MNIQDMIGNAVVWVREFLAAVEFEKWYGVLMAVVSSFASELLFAWGEPTEKKKRDDRTPEQRGGIAIGILRVVIYLLAYAVFLAVSVLAYVITQNIRLGTSGVWKNFLKMIVIFWNEYKTVMILVPVVVKILNLADRGRSRLFRSVVIFFLILIMLFAPSVITYPRGNRLMIEPLLLEQLKETPFPFVTRFYDASHFWDNFGYEAPTDGSGQTDPGNEPLPSGETENMSFDELMEAVVICGKRNEKELQKIYVDAAYALYQNGHYEDSFNVGLMWYYKGEFEESAEFYARGGEVYERISQPWNAVICYRNAYRVDWKPEYAEKAIENHYQHAQSGVMVLQTHINNIAQLLTHAQSHYEGDIPHLDDFCEMYPDNLAIQMVRIMRHIQDGTFDESDGDIITNLGSLERVTYCPKLALVGEYYDWYLGNGRGQNIDELYDRYQQDSELYEPEDILNLAWFWYMNGEYTKAYKLAAEAVVDGAALKDAYPLIAEIYLQDAGALPALDGEELAADLTEAVGEIRPWYSEDDLLRFNLVTLLLSNRIGLELDLSQVIGQARELFDGDTFTEGLIQATLDYEDGRYADCVEKCDRILDIEVPGGNLHKALFLQTDALIEMARATDDQEERIQLLTKAEDAMKMVQMDVEDDYIECLNRLSAIYSDMPDREAERMEVNGILQAF
ncbi:MAG: hypothetical protein NC305_02220 [Lachnospiraceae bacterium]|nr:hypothetical protein [Butyrivibrio sp.]MCM1343314.1 hypothetical protein [Muribaculaceae bacterium]MCM1409346.1 hypothetical protein [Lachnospiraceae bacterium]